MKLRSRSRALSLFVIGGLLGAIMLSPVVAAPNDPATKKFARKIANKKAKKKTNKLKKQLQPQINANAAGVAANGASIGTKQTACQPGAALAFVNVDVSETAGAYSADGTSARFNCKDPAGANTVLVKRQGTGLYRISLPGITTVVPDTVKWVAAGTLVANNVNASMIQVFPFTDPSIDQRIVDVYMENDSGAAADFDFQVVLFGYSGLPGVSGMSKAPTGEAAGPARPEAG